MKTPTNYEKTLAAYRKNLGEDLYQRKQAGIKGFLGDQSEHERSYEIRVWFRLLTSFIRACEVSKDIDRYSRWHAARVVGLLTVISDEVEFINNSREPL